MENDFGGFTCDMLRCKSNRPRAVRAMGAKPERKFVPHAAEGLPIQNRLVHGTSSVC